MLLKSKKTYKKLKVNYSKKPENKIRDYGLGILKTYLSLLVIATHFFSRNTTKNEIISTLYDNRYIHVPSFFIMSFYFTCHNLLSLDPKKIINRFFKLLIPYIGWPIIILYINRKYNQKFITKYNRKFNKKLPDSIEELKSQLYWGFQYMRQFWFQWDLIATTLLFVLIIFIFRKNCLFVLQLLLILFYYFQYTGNYFKEYLKPKSNNIDTIMRMFEMIPLGVTGFTLGYFNVIKKLNKYKLQTLIISYIIFHVVNNYQLFRKINGFQYQGIDLNIKSICIIFIFSLFPSDKITNIYYQKVFNLLTNYSAGPFYLHISMYKYCNNYIDEIKNKTFLGVVYNFLICYSISVLGDLILGKTPLKYLFC